MSPDLEAPIGRTHARRLARPVSWEDDALRRGALDLMEPEKRAALVRRVNAQLADLERP